MKRKLNWGNFHVLRNHPHLWRSFINPSLHPTVLVAIWTIPYQTFHSLLHLPYRCLSTIVCGTVATVDFWETSFGGNLRLFHMIIKAYDKICVNKQRDWFEFPTRENSLGKRNNSCTQPKSVSIINRTLSLSSLHDDHLRNSYRLILEKCWMRQVLPAQK